jgi:hypothetical protein
MKIMMLAFAPRELMTAWRAESVKSVIQVKDMSSAAGRVNLKTLSIINSFFGLAMLTQETASVAVGIHSTFANLLASFQHGLRTGLAPIASVSATFIEKQCTYFWKNGWIGVTNGTFERSKNREVCCLYTENQPSFANLDISDKYASLSWPP